jgi:hypothetical protein
MVKCKSWFVCPSSIYDFWLHVGVFKLLLCEHALCYFDDNVLKNSNDVSKLQYGKWDVVNGRRADNTMVKCKSTNNDQRYIKQKGEDSATRAPQKKEVNAYVPDG